MGMSAKQTPPRVASSRERVRGILTRSTAAATSDAPAIQDRAAKQADKDAQQARSKQYHIGIKAGGNVTKPSDAANVPDAQFADPVNYRYPMRDKTHADNAAARWGDADNRTQYDSAEQKIIAARIAARQKDFGEEPEDDSAQKGDKGERVTAGSAELSTTTALLYAPFVRRDAATWEVEGVLTSEAVDTYGTIFDYDSAKAAVERWAGNVREQHDLHKAVGRRVAFRCDDATRQVWLRVRISRGAPDTWAKINDGTLTGFSIGAFNAKMTHRVVEGRSVPCYTDYDYGEVSVVDVPSNPDARGSGLLVCRLADYANAAADEVGAICDDLPDLASATPDVTPEPEPEPEPEPVIRADAAADPTSTPAAADPSAPFGSPELAALLDTLPPAVRAQVERAAAAAAASPSPSTPAQASQEQDRAIGLGATGEGFQGNDTSARADADGQSDAVDDGTDNEKPVGMAMISDSGHVHEHTHAHTGSFYPSHVHDHAHVHQDGTAHSHPHMHNHAHHEHYGDPDHAHTHEHPHDHVHEFRVAAPDTSVVSCPQPGDSTQTQPTPAVAGQIGAAEQIATAEADAQDQRAAAPHAPFTGKHTHAHPAFGSQGGDASHEHEHAHDGDAKHDHHSGDTATDDAGEDERVATGLDTLTAVVGADTSASPPVGQAPQTQENTRAGQRISADTRAGLHEAALAILRTCDCPICQDACSLYDPDDDGDDDVEPGGVGDTDGDAGSDGDGGEADDDGGEERAAAAARRANKRARAQKLARIHLTRAARVAVAAETAAALAPIQQQFRAIAARLTAVQTADEELTRVESQLGEVRNAQATMAAALASVQGLVEQIAAQPAPGGPILRAADRTLALAPGAVLDASAPYGYGTAAGRASVGTPGTDGGLDNLPPEVLAAAVKQLQRNGQLTDQESQLRAATTIAAAEIARTRRP